MKIIHVSDLHGFLPRIPPCDILTIGGDIMGPRSLAGQIKHLSGPFAEWLYKLSQRNISVVGIAGNHDHFMEYYPQDVAQLEWHYLNDSSVEINGIKFWGTAASLTFGYDWAFNFSEEQIARKLEQIPFDTNIILSHGPPYTILDEVCDGGRVGSVSLLNFLHNPSYNFRYLLTGHIHYGRGRTKYYGITCINGSFVDENYEPYQIPLEEFEYKEN